MAAYFVNSNVIGSQVTIEIQIFILFYFILFYSIDMGSSLFFPQIHPLNKMFREEVTMETLLPFFDYCLVFAPSFVVESMTEHFEKNYNTIDPKSNVGIRLQLKHLYEELDKPLRLIFLEKFDHLVCHFQNSVVE